MNIFEKQEIGNKIKRLREEFNMSQGEFAKELNIKVHDLKNWERGVSLPSQKKIERILSFKPKKYGKKIVITEEELKKMKDEISDEAFGKVFAMLMAIPLKVLNEEGWGEVRLNRFLDKSLELLKEVEQGTVDIYSINKGIKDRYGIEIGWDKNTKLVNRS